MTDAAGGTIRKSMASYRDLIVWTKAMDLTEAVYRVARSFPKDEIYRLTSQITRAAVSIPANIAEGNGRATSRDYAHFLAIARGSALEVETLILLAIRLEYITQNQADACLSLTDEVSRMLFAMQKRLRGQVEVEGTD
jgi:four helix bundle protein